MAGPFTEVQTAVYNRLRGYSALTALIGAGNGRIYDQVPESNAVFPYVTLGEIVSLPFDTKDSIGQDQTVTLHVWSRYKGNKEVKQILDAIYDALHRHALSLASHATVDCKYEYSETYRDEDNTRNGIIRFRITTQQT